MSTARAATRAALPLDEPPEEREGSRGLRTGPVAELWPAPPKENPSVTALPAMIPPASRIRVTTVASTSGTNPSITAVPAPIGTPATQMVSLSATRFPSSSPVSLPRMSVMTYQAPNGFSEGSGRRPGVRGYFTSGFGSTIASTAA